MSEISSSNKFAITKLYQILITAIFMQMRGSINLRLFKLKIVQNRLVDLLLLPYYLFTIVLAFGPSTGWIFEDNISTMWF